MAAGPNGNRMERDGEGDGKGGGGCCSAEFSLVFPSWKPVLLHTLSLSFYIIILVHILHPQSVLFSFIAEFVLHVWEFFSCVQGDNRKLMTVLVEWPL